MDKFRTVAPIILMLLTALVVFYANVSLSGSGFGGAILFAMIAPGPGWAGTRMAKLTCWLLPFAR